MSREIKFRAWDTRFNKWATNVGIFVNDGEPIWYDRHCGDETELVFRDCQDGTYILMQFTGLHDKNGKDIYEGDILKLSDEYRGKGEIPAYVIWENSQWTMQGTMHYSHKDFIGNYSLNNMVIIGNIYENPELL